MAIPKGPYIPAASCGYNERYPAEPSKLTETSAKKSDNKIEKKSDNDDNLMMIGTTGLSTGLCFTALAFGGTIIAPTILTVASVAVVGAGVGIAGYYAVEYVKNQFKNTTAPSSNPSSHQSTKPSKTPSTPKKIPKEQGRRVELFLDFKKLKKF
jgi:hypothetical protein